MMELPAIMPRKKFDDIFSHMETIGPTRTWQTDDGDSKDSAYAYSVTRGKPFDYGRTLSYASMLYFAAVFFPPP